MGTNATPAPAKSIDVFLTFASDERNSFTNKNGTKVEKGPDWDALRTQLVKAGYTLTVHGPSFQPSVTEFKDSLSKAEVTLVIGHGLFGATPNSPGSPTKYVANQIKLTDGMIMSPDGLYQGTWQAGVLEGAGTASKLKVNRITGLFTCNSRDEMPKAFDTSNGQLLTNDGGEDGFTRVGTLEQAAYAFLVEYGKSKGNLSSSLAKAQFIFNAAGRAYRTDRGDKLELVQ